MYLKAPTPKPVKPENTSVIHVDKNVIAAAPLSGNEISQNKTGPTLVKLTPWIEEWKGSHTIFFENQGTEKVIPLTSCWTVTRRRNTSCFSCTSDGFLKNDIAPYKMDDKIQDRWIDGDKDDLNDLKFYDFQKHDEHIKQNIKICKHIASVIDKLCEREDNAISAVGLLGK